MENKNEGGTTTAFGFPIKGILEEAPMKNILLFSLPNFYGMTSENPNTFLFKFEDPGICLEESRIQVVYGIWW